MLSIPAPPSAAHSDLQQLSLTCKAAGDELRLSVLRLLGQGAFGVLELCQVFDIKQSSMSHHLKTLLQAGLVSTQREGNRIFYRRPLLTGSDAWTQWAVSLFNAIDQSAEPDTHRQAIQQVLAERARACADFFTRHADDFKQQQDLIASHDQYGDALLDIINQLSSNVRSSNTESASALDIGSGDGWLIPELSQRFEQVVALDVSSSMLEKTQQRVDAEQLNNVTCLLGDTELAIERNDRFQMITANMVLHHVPTPKVIFQHAATLLTLGGGLLITDLCHHDQAWAHESCGDLWLGFEPDDLSSWAAEVGLHEGPSQFLGLRNGFQIQFRVFYKPHHSDPQGQYN